LNHYAKGLPHWDAADARQFVTFRPHGTLPASRVVHAKDISAGQAFVTMDRLLDSERSGPADLAQITKRLHGTSRTQVTQ
jgi:hypothetical protein